MASSVVDELKKANKSLALRALTAEDAAARAAADIARLERELAASRAQALAGGPRAGGAGAAASALSSPASLVAAELSSAGRSLGLVLRAGAVARGLRDVVVGAGQQLRAWQAGELAALEALRTSLPERLAGWASTLAAGEAGSGGSGSGGGGGGGGARTHTLNDPEEGLTPEAADRVPLMRALTSARASVRDLTSALAGAQADLALQRARAEHLEGVTASLLQAQGAAAAAAAEEATGGAPSALLQRPQGAPALQWAAGTARARWPGQ
jgi:hypothetical protein